MLSSPGLVSSGPWGSAAMPAGSASSVGQGWRENIDLTMGQTHNSGHINQLMTGPLGSAAMPAGSASSVGQSWRERIDPRNLTMGLDLDNSGHINQLMTGPLGIDVNGDGNVDVVITPEMLREFILEETAAGAVPPAEPTGFRPPPSPAGFPMPQEPMQPALPSAPVIKLPPIFSVAPAVRMEMPASVPAAVAPDPKLLWRDPPTPPTTDRAVTMPDSPKSPPREPIMLPAKVTAVAPAEVVEPAAWPPPQIMPPEYPTLPAAYVQMPQPSYVQMPQPIAPRAAPVVSEPQDPGWAVREVVEKPYYIKQVVDRPYLVDRRTQREMVLNHGGLSEVEVKFPIRVSMKKVSAAHHDRDFPYHNPAPRAGCGFIGHFFPATTENPFLD